ncbi:hypothetical protein MTO98_09565 [Mucilaginibacter sp. SMC90]|uniref:hypothetical protein n=1 Tax=Mucilaginibacter sp. SMC90 TaxID=2929803 RepID=UPI001FB2E6EE|nr:hypothetical protein [Mucilaginibacter sp. SMC90]UOE51325.1 hypothetical protein MTO98_09565 [Mucilaginibacter sp. SMC90]
MPLNCKINIDEFSKGDKSCGGCNICQPYSALRYPFQRDLANSEGLVKELEKFIHESTGLLVSKTTVHENPDLLVRDSNGKLIARVEAKYLEGKAFMKAAKILGEPLFPKETLVVDTPKLLSYFSCKEIDLREQGRNIPIYVVWKFDRPCADVGGICVYQEVNILKSIYQLKKTVRSYTRQTGQGDFVDGIKRGVTDKFHFSISECLPIEKLPANILQHL